MKHLDLFSGIGGFAYAADQVWDDVEHIFCDNDKFCRQVLKKHWPNSKIYNDIREITEKSIITHTRSGKLRGLSHLPRKKSTKVRIDIVTGGFPCQPFSQAGKRKGTDDDRYLWPEMLRVIQLANPKWVVAENVRGLLTQSGGLVFEQVCLDLEAAGYEVQPFIIPAVAKNAPHRRDRVWFIAHRVSDQYRTDRGKIREAEIVSGECGEEVGGGRISGTSGDAKNPLCERGSGRSENGRQILERQSTETETARPSGESGDDFNPSIKRLERICKSEQPQRLQNAERTGWEKNWLEVATELCRVDDGLSPELDFAGWTKARHRVERLKSLGNAIVPQVAIEILKSIKANH